MTKHLKTILFALDVIICITWVSHLTVTYWRSTWNLVDIYILPEKPYASAAATTAFGVVVCSVLKSLMPVFDKYITKKNRILYTIVTRVISYILALGTVAQWRGVWYLIDYVSDLEWVSNAISIAVTLQLMFIFQISVNVINNPPLMIGYDEADDFLCSKGRFGIKPSRPFLYVVDIFLYQLFTVSLVASAWRATWNLYNALVLPDHPVYSNLVTQLGGALLTCILVAIQKPMARLSIRLGKFMWITKLILHQVYIVFGIAGNIALWRGWWNNMNILEEMLFSSMEIGSWVGHIVGVLGLALTGMMCSLFDMFIKIDGEILEEYTFWPIGFLQIIFRKKIEKDYEVTTAPTDKTAQPTKDTDENVDSGLANPAFVISLTDIPKATETQNTSNGNI